VGRALEMILTADMIDAARAAEMGLVSAVVPKPDLLPKAKELLRRVTKKTPRLLDLHARVAARPRVAAYLASDRRIPFNEEGIFRRYPELD
jgi:glutathione S-transferase